MSKVTDPATTLPFDIGVVVIGRNEGDRLARCLDVLPRVIPTVYVDSGSTDDSLAKCCARGVEVVELDLSKPFTAARARNVGANKLLATHPDIQYIQFIDGDCELVSGWLESGRHEFEINPQAGVLCGRTRERAPESSLYNRLCELEWDVPAGVVPACGGIMLVRTDVFKLAGGFDPAVIAAEDDEFCLRVRRTGRTIVRVSTEMVLHDAAMTRVSQWWTRAVRTGYAYALGVAMHGDSPDRHFVRERRRALIWGAVVPLGAIGAGVLTGGWGLILAIVYPLQLVHTYRKVRRRVSVRRHALAYAVSCVIAKVPQAIGVLRHTRDSRRRRVGQLIEYK